jgi:hypothetical protein
MLLLLNDATFGSQPLLPIRTIQVEWLRHIPNVISSTLPYNTTCNGARQIDILSSVPHSEQPLVPIETSLGATVNAATIGT